MEDLLKNWVAKGVASKLNKFSAYPRTLEHKLLYCTVRSPIQACNAIAWLYHFLRSLDFFIGKRFSRPYEKILSDNVMRIHYINFNIQKFNKRFPLCPSRVLCKIDNYHEVPFSRFHWSYTAYFPKYLYKYLLPVRVLFNGPLLNFNFFCFSKKSLPCS